MIDLTSPTRQWGKPKKNLENVMMIIKSTIKTFESDQNFTNKIWNSLENIMSKLNFSRLVLTRYQMINEGNKKFSN